MSSDIILSPPAFGRTCFRCRTPRSLMTQTQNRLATGKKVNSALDNPLNFFTSSSLSTRASRSQRLLDSMSNGIQTIQAANNGLTAITSPVQQLQSTVSQAAPDNPGRVTAYTTTRGHRHRLAEEPDTSRRSIIGGGVNVALNDRYLRDASRPCRPPRATWRRARRLRRPPKAAPMTACPARPPTRSRSTAGHQPDQRLTGDNSTHARHAKARSSPSSTRAWLGTFTVGSNTAGDGFKITGKADGTNDVTVSNQAGTGAAGIRRPSWRRLYRSRRGRNLHLRLNGNATAITLDSTTGDTAANAQAQSSRN